MNYRANLALAAKEITKETTLSACHQFENKATLIFH